MKIGRDLKILICIIVSLSLIVKPSQGTAASVDQVFRTVDKGGTIYNYDPTGKLTETQTLNAVVRNKYDLNGNMVSRKSVARSLTQWQLGNGLGSNTRFINDVNGDGKADAVLFFKDTGTWYVSLSNGQGIKGFQRWITGHGVGSDAQLLADVNGDGKADAVIVNYGSWYVALSSGSGFEGYKLWVSGHGVGASGLFLADVNGDGKADAVIENSGI
ncbi:VCBS repeat-containing protein [Paenibacillus sp. FSL K6-1217]|uniref:FG-GAP repeat domain-containing protein n=1 Tax=Paenibacillus sp. FSL K6-1217 TaxID=2921466 RepID=UPI00324B22DE